MSTLEVTNLNSTNVTATNLTDGGGTTSTFANVARGSAKAYSNSTSASVLNEGFNISSTADSATAGRTDVNLTSAMSSTNYVVNSNTVGTSNDGLVSVRIESSSLFKSYVFDANTGSRTDYRVGSTVTGDLA